MRPSSQAPVHQQLREWLLRTLDNFGPATRLPTEYELARRFAVSRPTVHRVMAELQRDGYVVRHPGRGTFVVPRDKRVHTANRAGDQGTVLIAYPDWFSYDIWAKVECAERLALKHGLRLVNFKITREGALQALAPVVAAQKDLRGLLVVPPGGGLAGGDLATLARLAPRTVALMAAPERVLPASVWAVSQDFQRLGYLGVSALATAGHTALGYVAAEPWHYGSGQAWQGMKEALAAHHLPPSALRRSRRPTRSWEDSMRLGYSLTGALLAEQPVTGLIYDSVPTAMAGLRALWERRDGLAEQISVVVNADYFSLENYLWPSVQVIAADLHALVGRAFDLLLSPQPPRTHSHTVAVAVQSASGTALRERTLGAPGFPPAVAPVMS